MELLKFLIAVEVMLVIFTGLFLASAIQKVKQLDRAQSDMKKLLLLYSTKRSAQARRRL